MSYYQFNRQEILQKAKEIYSKEKAAEYYLQNKEARLKSTKEKGTKNWFSIKKKHYKINELRFFCSIWECVKRH